MFLFFTYVFIVSLLHKISGFQSSDCKYSITYNSATQLKYDWKCPEDGSKVCLKVYHCEAFDKVDYKQLVVDDNGCTTNKQLMSDITYPTDVSASATSDYNWLSSTRQKLFFQCQLNFSNKPANASCPRPNCAAALRRRRHVPFHFKDTMRNF